MHMATNNIGKILMDEDGDLAGARAAFLKALASDDKKAAALAQNNLGVLLLKEGNAASARAAFRLALETGDSTAMEYATNNLAALPEEA